MRPRSIALTCVAAGLASLVPLGAGAQETPAAFKGVIGTTERESRPDYPVPVRPKPGSPNIIYIVLDDAGFSDLGAFGSEIATPNIDKLAAGGLRYNNFHTKAVCSPSRASLLTGRNSHSVGVGNLTNFISGYPNERGEITHAAATVAEMLRAVGYNTYALGKWHVVRPWDEGPTGPFDQWPLQRGFDRYYGYLDAMTDQYYPDIVQDNTRVPLPKNPNYNLSTDLVDHAIADIRNQIALAPNNPFFMYLALGATHAPHQAPKELIDKYMPVFAKGWDKTRADRLARQKEMGLVPANTELTDRTEGVTPWDDLPPDLKKFDTRLQAAFAGYLELADSQIGRLLAYLDQTGQRDNTLIVLLSDNGASPEGGLEGTNNAIRAYAAEDNPKALGKGPKVVMPGGTLAEQMQHYDEIGTAKSWPNYPIGWANAGNTPFRYFKYFGWAGGEHDPLIVSWPAKIKQAGAIRRQFVDIIDITPTVLDVAGVPVPTTFAGVPQMPLAGKSFAASFDNPQAPDARHSQYFELFGQRAIWHDGWKAITDHGIGEDDFAHDHWMLFNVNQDFSETHDLATAFPDKLKELQALWMEQAKQYGVLPLDGRGMGKLNQDFMAHTARRTELTLYPGNEHLPPFVAPQLGADAFSITAYVTRTGNDVSGVMLANGDALGGYVFYVMNNKPVFDWNWFGRHDVVTSNTEVPQGSSVLKYDYTPTGNRIGIGTLSIDGKEVGRIDVHQPPTVIISSFAGMDVGRDTKAPVSDAYAAQGEFAFTPDALQKVTIEVRPAVHP